MESTLNKEYIQWSLLLLPESLRIPWSIRCDDIRNKITQLSEGDYAIAKSDVDRLRQELGQPPLPTLQSTLDEKTSQ
jgi:hypothetical protein